MTNRVREIRTPGSVGALGGNPQSDPAREAPFLTPRSPVRCAAASVNTLRGE